MRTTMSVSETTPTTRRSSSTTGTPDTARAASSAATSLSGVSDRTAITGVVMISRIFISHLPVRRHLRPTEMLARAAAGRIGRNADAAFGELPTPLRWIATGRDIAGCCGERFRGFPYAPRRDSRESGPASSTERK